MSLTLKDLRVLTSDDLPGVQRPEWLYRPATLADLVEVLKQEGAEELWWCDVRRAEDKNAYRRTVSCHVNTNGTHNNCGPRLVLPLGDTP